MAAIPARLSFISGRQTTLTDTDQRSTLELLPHHLPEGDGLKVLGQPFFIIVLRIDRWGYLLCGHAGRLYTL